MSLIVNTGFESFKPWSGAVSTYKELDNLDMLYAFENMLEELYPDGISEGEINDFLWFSNQEIYEYLGIVDMDEIDEDELIEKAESYINLEGLESVDDIIEEINSGIRDAISDLGDYIVNEHSSEKYILQTLNYLIEMYGEDEDEYECFPKELSLEANQKIEKLTGEMSYASSF